MATALAHTELQESQLREQLQAMAASLADSKAAAGSARDQAAQLQRALTASEHDRKMLQVSVGFIACTCLQFDNCHLLILEIKVVMKRKLRLYFLVMYCTVYPSETTS